MLPQYSVYRPSVFFRTYKDTRLDPDSKSSPRVRYRSANHRFREDGGRNHRAYATTGSGAQHRSSTRVAGLLELQRSRPCRPRPRRRRRRRPAALAPVWFRIGDILDWPHSGPVSGAQRRSSTRVAGLLELERPVWSRKCDICLDSGLVSGAHPAKVDGHGEETDTGHNSDDDHDGCLHADGRLNAAEIGEKAIEGGTR
jgi:hypothetical protein